MNFKSSILTICLTVSALLAPQKAFGLDHQNKEVHLLCVREAKDHLNCKVETKENKSFNIQKAKKIENSKSSLTDAMPALSTNRAVALHNQYSHTDTHEVLIIVLIWGSSISLWLFLYIKRRKNRLAIMRQNVEALERLWKINNYH